MRSAALLPEPTRRSWRAVQYGLLAFSVALVWLLLFRPTLGLAVLWNVLIPVAPAVIVIAPGVWRNVCPMATFSLLPQRLGLSRRRIMSPDTAGPLSLISVAALVVIVPARHLAFNTDGPSSALLLVAAAVTAASMGLVFESRSGWCTSLCPVHPVEKLYAMSPALTVPNARCSSCARCTSPCPDLTESMSPQRSTSALGRGVGLAFSGAFAGFIWGWYQLPDHPNGATLADAVRAYAWPLGGAASSLALFAAARRWLCRDQASRTTLVRLAAAAAVGVYYWYRLPALVGFGPHEGTGLLCDLTQVLPAWSPLLSRALTTSFFAWFLLVRSRPKHAWMLRPPATP